MLNTNAFWIILIFELGTSLYSVDNWIYALFNPKAETELYVEKCYLEVVAGSLFLLASIMTFR